VPLVDDEFAKDMECADLVALRVKVREDIGNIKRDNEKERLKNAILTDIIERHEIEVPESLENKYLMMLMNRALDNMRSGNPAPGDANLTADQLKERYAPLAARSVREDIVLDSIADKEKVEVADDEVEAAVRHLAGARGVPYEDLMGRIEREGASGVIKDGLRHEKVFDVIFRASKGLGHWVEGASAPEVKKPKAAAKPGAAAKPKADAAPGAAKPKAAPKKKKTEG
jgi:trigger factor